MAKAKGRPPQGATSRKAAILTARVTKGFYRRVEAAVARRQKAGVRTTVSELTRTWVQKALEQDEESR